MAATTSNQKLEDWVEHWKGVFEADDVYWCDGTAEEYERLAQDLVDAVLPPERQQVDHVAAGDVDELAVGRHGDVVGVGRTGIVDGDRVGVDSAVAGRLRTIAGTKCALSGGGISLWPRRPARAERARARPKSGR